jgi:hypothetical protein
MSPADEPILGPPLVSPTEALLEAKSIAVALDAVARGDAGPVERRAFPARGGRREWNPLHLRLVRDQPIAVYDLLGEIEVALDADGKIVALDDPRNRPSSNEVHVSEPQAIARVAHLMGVAPASLDLAVEVVRRDGLAHLRVRNRATGEGDVDKGKFFQKKAEVKAGPPPDRIDAELDASTGRIYRFRRDPAPPEASA